MEKILKELELSRLSAENGCSFKTFYKNEWFNSLTLLEKMDVVRCGFDKQFKNYDKMSELCKKRWLHFKKHITEDKQIYIDILDSYFNNLSESSVRVAMIQIVGKEETCKISHNTLKEGILAKKQSYIDAYTFNIFGANVSFELLEGLVVHDIYGKNFKFLGYPNYEQFEYAILRPDNVPYISLNINDFGITTCIDTNLIVLDYTV